jgi:archaemetzincin
MRKLLTLVSIALLLLASAASRAQAPQAMVRARMHIVVFSGFPTAWVDPIVRELEEHLSVQAIVEPGAIALPRSAYYAPRRRYRAEILTDFLAGQWRAHPSEDRVIGLTSRDISTSTERFRDWGILGLTGELGGRSAVVSSFRMRRRTTEEHALWRMTTTVVHEAGHVLGLEHCPEPACIMRDAQGTMDTVDAGDGRLGPECMRILDRNAPRRFPRR